MQNSREYNFVQASAPSPLLQTSYMKILPVANMQPQMTYQPQMMHGASIYQNGMGGPMMYSNLRMKALEDSFTNGPMIPALRAYRDDGEEAAAKAATVVVAAQEDKPQVVESQDEAKTSEVVEQIKTDDKEDDKNSRIARFIMEKDEAENRLE